MVIRLLQWRRRSRRQGAASGRMFTMPDRSTLVVAALALVLAFFSFMNARVGVGLMVMPDTHWGPGFDLIRPQMSALQRQQARPGFRDQQAVSRVATIALQQAPLNARALRMLALNDDLSGRKQAAQAKMIMVDRLSRREGVAQLWLADLNSREGDVAKALQHMDVILRTMPEATDPLLERLALAIQLPEARVAIRPFIRASTPWMERFFHITLEKAPSVRPLGELVASLDRAPDVDRLANSYGTLVYRLASQDQYDVLRQTYPKLPGVNTDDLYDVSLKSAGSNGGFVPVIWDFGTRSDRGGALLGLDRAEFFAIGEVSGVAASKVVFFKQGASRQLLFRKLEGEPGERSRAFWRITCVLGAENGRVVQSVNLLEMPNNALGKLAVSQQCAAATLEMMVDGGTRRSPTRVVLSGIGLGQSTR